MPRTLHLLTAIFLLLNSTHVLADNKGPSHCDKPFFTEFQPAANKYTQMLTEFSMTASSNTNPESIHVTVVFGENEFHFGPKELKIEKEPSGRYDITGKLMRPLAHGFARINVTAHSKPGCEKQDGFLVRIQ